MAVSEAPALAKVLGKYVSERIGRFLPENVVSVYGWRTADFPSYETLVATATALHSLQLVCPTSNDWGDETQEVVLDWIPLDEIESVRVIWKTREGFHKEGDFELDILSECRCEITLKRNLGSLGKEIVLPRDEELNSNLSSERINANVHRFSLAVRKVMTDGG